MRIILPNGSEVGKRLSTTVCPTTQTFAAERISPSVKKLPRANCQLRTVKYSVLTPDISLQYQFRLPAINWPLAPTIGEAANTEGQSFAMASASAAFKLTTVPAPCWTPPSDRLLGKTINTFVPRVLNCSCTIKPADWLIEISRITAHTPMTIPSTVKVAPILFFAKARSETRMVIQKFMNCLCAGSFLSLWRGGFRGGSYACDHFAAFIQIVRDQLGVTDVMYADFNFHRREEFPLHNPNVLFVAGTRGRLLVGLQIRIHSRWVLLQVVCHA